MTAFGLMIRSGRKKKGITQVKLSESVDCSPEHIARIEIGRSQPSVALLEKVFSILDIQPFKGMIISEDPKKQKQIDQLLSNIEKMSISEVELLTKISKVMVTKETTENQKF